MDRFRSCPAVVPTHDTISDTFQLFWQQTPVNLHMSAFIPAWLAANTGSSYNRLKSCPVEMNMHMCSYVVCDCDHRPDMNFFFPFPEEELRKSFGPLAASTCNHFWAEKKQSTETLKPRGVVNAPLSQDATSWSFIKWLVTVLTTELPGGQ